MNIQVSLDVGDIDRMAIKYELKYEKDKYLSTNVIDGKICSVRLLSCASLTVHRGN